MPIDQAQLDGMSKLSEEYLKSVSLSQLRDRAYTPYELEKYERESLEDIRIGLKKGRYNTKAKIQGSLEFLEKLANKINIAVTNERKENKTTWELESDLTDIKRIFEELNKLLLTIETKEVDEGSKSGNIKIRKR